MDLESLVKEIEQLECVDTVKTAEVSEGQILHIVLKMEYSKSDFDEESKDWRLYNAGSYDKDLGFSSRTVVKRLYAE